MREDIRVGSTQVAIDSVQPYEGNARQGDVPAIADSLRVNGQYRPIVVNGRTGEIIAGTHTWKAAKRLGWRTIAVTFLDVEDAHALAIMLVDNRTADLALTDDERVLALLETLPSLDGTGYTEADMALMGLPTDLGADSAAASESATDAPQPDGIPVQVGSVHFEITDDSYGVLRAGLPRRNGDAIAEVLHRLGIVEPETPHDTATSVTFSESETVGIETLVAYPGNPRQGDISAIAASLNAHGQYRPVVVSRRTNRVLVGNHTVAAAVDLGWAEIGVVYADVDEEGERRIVLADNRTSDLATYDQEALERLVGVVAGYGLLHVSGWDLADLEAPLMPGTPDREATVRVGSLRTRVRVSLVRRLGSIEPAWVLARLGLDTDALV